jgi:hypothetical protein
MANSTYCSIICAGPTNQVQALRQALENQHSPPLSVFTEPGTATSIPFFHRIYGFQIQNYCEGPQEGEFEVWGDLSRWQSQDGLYPHLGDPELLISAAELGKNEALLSVEIEFRLMPPPMLPFLAAIYPGCRWRVQIGFGGLAEDWVQGPEAFRECVESSVPCVFPKSALMDVRLGFNKDSLREEIHIGNQNRGYGVCNGFRIFREAPTRLCQRFLVECETGNIDLSEGGRHKNAEWSYIPINKEIPARSIVFGLADDYVDGEAPQGPDRYLGSVKVDPIVRGAGEGWIDIEDWKKDADPSFIPFAAHEGVYMETTEVFNTKCGDMELFEQQMYELLRTCNGELSVFFDHAIQLRSLVSGGECRVFNVVCESEDKAIDLEFSKDYTRLRFYPED